MKISGDYQTYTKPNFGMSVIATKRACSHLNKHLSAEQAQEVGRMCSEQLNRTPHVYLSTYTFEHPINGEDVTCLSATVGEKRFDEGVFKSTIDVIKDSIEYVKNFQK